MVGTRVGFCAGSGFGSVIWLSVGRVVDFLVGLLRVFVEAMTWPRGCAVRRWKWPSLIYQCPHI